MNAVEKNPDIDVNRVLPGSEGVFSVIELKEAAQLTDKLILAAKNISFYPRDHAIAQRSIKDAYDKLASFVERYGTFVIGIEQSVLHYKGRDLSRKNPFHKELAYKCFRDGIQYLVFSKSISLDVFDQFIRIVSRRSLMEDDAEGDMVTDMWEARLTGIKYTVNDNLWEKESLLDISRLKIGTKATTHSSDHYSTLFAVDEPGGETGENPLRSLWQLTPEEIEATRRMVSKENHRTFDQDVFDVFLLILKDQRDKEDFSNVLEVIIECFKRTLFRCEFASANRFLRNIRKIQEQYQADNFWALPLLDDFMMMISSRRILAPLSDCLKKYNHRDAGMLKDLESMLRRLAPECVTVLGTMLPEMSSVTVRKCLNRAILHLTANDPRPLYQLAKSPSTAVARQAIMNLSRLGKADHVPIIMEAAGSEDILLKRVAVKALTNINPPPYSKILPFVLDEDKNVRKTIFNFLVLNDDADTETFLLDYISNTKFSMAHEPSVTLLYMSLGRIGSKKTYDFLKKKLFGSPWWAGKVRFLHRQGAAIAFLQQDAPEAAQLLKKAAKSLWPTVRKAVRQNSRLEDTSEYSNE